MANGLSWQAQKELAVAVIKDATVAREVDGLLRPEHFENPALGALVQTALAYRKEHQDAPTAGVLLEGTRTLPDPLNGATASLLPELLELAPGATTWSVATLRSMVASAEMHRLAGEIPSLAAQGDYSEIVRRARDITVKTAARGEMTYGSGSYEAVLQRHALEVRAVPTGVTRLDQFLGGGLQVGRLGHLLGKKGGGKSHGLVAFSTAALLLKKRVFFASLEMGEPEIRARHDRCITGLSGAAFLENLFANYEKLKDVHEKLTVLAATDRPLTMGGLLAALDRCPEQPDLLVVDYAGIMSSGAVYQGKDPEAARRHAMGKIAQDMHMLAQERNLPIWTAYQANRIGMFKLRKHGQDGEDDTLDVTDYAESTEPAWHADVIISINQSDTETILDQGRLFIAENRGGRNRIPIQIYFDKSTSRLRDFLDGLPQGVRHDRYGTNDVRSQTLPTPEPGPAPHDPGDAVLAGSGACGAVSRTPTGASRGPGATDPTSLPGCQEAA